MAGQDDDAEKSHEPTQHKLDEARKKGEVAKSTDLTTAAVYGGFLLTAIAAGAASVKSISNALMILIGQADSLSLEFLGENATPHVGGLMLAIGGGIAAWFLIPPIAAILSVVAQRAFVVAPEKIKPKLSRINPVQNAKNKYGLSGLFEFLKSFIKLLVYSALLFVFLTYKMPEMTGALYAEPTIIGAMLTRLAIEFMFVVLVIAIGIGALDWIFQKNDFLKKQRMSMRELKEEHKQQEGDPYMKQERRARAQSIAMSQMIAEVPKADVVIVNPTHYAVALKWSRKPGSAPVCIAKGVDHMAKTIRETAFEHGVPVHSDPPTARALYAVTELGAEISPDHYRAVAAAIRFADAMRKKARRI